MELMQASQQWSSRPADQRFVSLLDMQAYLQEVRAQSRATVVSSRDILAVPDEDNKGLTIRGRSGLDYAPTHYSFGQLAQLSGAPTGYLRSLPSPLAADCVNYGLKFNRGAEDVGLLLQRNGSNVLRAATGPRYGRIWNSDIVGGLVRAVGDGTTGQWTVPGEFGKAVQVTKENTTLYASDRDMFVFLADERNRIEVKDRRSGQPGSMARGFFVWNSEVGSTTFGISTFLFDYVCCNRIVWGAMDVKQFKLRHTASAPDRFIEEALPALQSYSDASAVNIIDAVSKAQKARIDNVEDFLASRFTKRLAAEMQTVHEAEEGRPIETLWDATTAVTARAKYLPWQDERVAMEREGGKIMELAQ